MKKHSALTLLLVVALFFGLAYTSRAAYAHNFSPDESAAYLAKAQEIPVEAHAVQSDITSNNITLVKWHLDKLAQYWNSSDTTQMAERNQLLAKEIPGAISNITKEASKPNPDAGSIKQFVSNLDSYMSESVPVRIDSDKLQNLTVSALALKSVLDEVMNDYGNATNNSGNLSSSQVNSLMTGNSNMSGMSMSGNMSSMSSQSSSRIPNKAAYESAQAMMSAVQNMWSGLKSKTPSSVSSNAISSLDTGFAKLRQIIDTAQPMDQFLIILHGTIHPNLMKAYNLQLAGMSDMSGMNMGGNSNMGSGSMQMSGSGTSQKRLAYISETAAQRHSEHLAMKMPTAGGYNANTNYTLASNGSDKVSLNLSVYKSTNALVAMDVMGGNVSVSGQPAVTIQSGHAYYLPGMNKLLVIGYAGQKDSMGMASGVQVLKLWSIANGKLPAVQSDPPMSAIIKGSASGLGDMQLSSQNATIMLASGSMSGNTTKTSGNAVSIMPGAQNLGDKAFSPNPISVKVGDKVTWTNTDTAIHTVTSGDGTTGTADGTFDSKV
ncbi:MAG: hypothetical protein ABI361_14320, partial [Nitrososphaera sp.]